MRILITALAPTVADLAHWQRFLSIYLGVIVVLLLASLAVHLLANRVQDRLTATVSEADERRLLNVVAMFPTPTSPGPRPCCGEYAVVTKCDGDLDTFLCGVCRRRWTQPCDVADLVPLVQAWPS